MRRTDQRGFSLVEVVVALGLLAGVLISIAGLFILGGRQVKSGRTVTEATSVARGILEEIDGWGFRQTYQMFGSDGSATSLTVNSRTNAYAQKWQPILDEKLVDAQAEIQVQSLIPTGAVPNLNVTRYMRVLVTVSWQENTTDTAGAARRERSVRLGTVRM